MEQNWRTIAKLVLSVVLVALATTVATGCAQTLVNEGIPPTEPATATVTVHPDSAIRITDLRGLMANSTHVFTGRVESTAGTIALDDTPQTQYSAMVGIALKGDVPQSVIVNQQGGTRDGVYTSVGGDKPLTIGQWYLFATRYLGTRAWYTVIPVPGREPMTEQQARDTNSEPLAAARNALRASPQSNVAPPETPSPTMTFPIPSPGDQHPPPPSTPHQR